VRNLAYLKNLQGKKKKKNPFLLNQWLKTKMTEGIERELRVPSPSGKPIGTLG